MAHPYRDAAHKSDPKWLGGVRKYADGGSVSEPSSADWAKAQATDLWNTGKAMVGVDSDTYKPFEETQKVSGRAKAYESARRADHQPEGRKRGGKV